MISVVLNNTGPGRSFVLIIFILLILSYIFNKTTKTTQFNARSAGTKLFLAGILTLIFSFFFACFIWDFSNEFTATGVCSSSYSTVVNYTTQCAINLDFIRTIFFWMLTIILVAIYYSTHFSYEDSTTFIIYTSFIFYAGIFFLLAENVYFMFIAYEMLLIPTSLLLYKFSKTVQRSHEAVKFMIIWTQIGAILVFTVLIVFAHKVGVFIFLDVIHKLNKAQLDILIICSFIGFGTKIPVWPFYWWLPEAHVEISTNFSIVLSGVVIKFAFLGLVRFISATGVSVWYWLFIPILFLGILDACLRLEAEVDIKKIVALQTVIEMHVLTIYLFADWVTFIDFIWYYLPLHCWVSTIQFIFVDIIAKRYHTRNITHLYGILACSPLIVKCVFYCLFLFNSIPGSLVYTAEYLILILATHNIFNIFIFATTQFLLVIVMSGTWFLLAGGDSLQYHYLQAFSLTKHEFTLIVFLMLQLLPGFFVFNIF